MLAESAAIIDIEQSDEEWARLNLRFDGVRPILDLANCLRVIERHPEFKGRYRYNEVLNKVLDRGTVMIEWRMIEFAATLQERFLPEIPFETASRALILAANKSNQK